MKIPALLAAFALAGAAFAQAPAVAPGDYDYVEGGFGHGGMSVKGAGFQIQTTGSNGHSCDASGTLKGDRGTTDDQPACHFKLVPTAQGFTLEVPEADFDACRSACGARAGFEGEYRKPPAACTSARRAARLEQARHAYRDKQYGAARDGLSSLVDECGVFFDNFEIDRVRNDLALAHLHAGDAAQCLKVLGQTYVGKSGALKPEDLSLAPADQDAYLPIAKATWHNMALCKAAPAK